MNAFVYRVAAALAGALAALIWVDGPTWLAIVVTVLLLVYVVLGATRVRS